MSLRLRVDFIDFAGTTTDGDKVITKVSAGGLAEGKLEVGDTVASVNGQSVAAMDHEDVLKVIVASLTISMVLRRVTRPLSNPAASAQRGSIRTVDPRVGSKVVSRKDSVGRGPR